MPGIFEKFGVRFLYPENWSIVDEAGDQWPETVSVQSPGGAFWALQIYPSERDPLQLTADVVREMRSEYVELDVEQVTEQVAGAELVGYDMDFYCLDMVVTSHARSFSHGQRTYLLLWQAEDREFRELEPVFVAITTSLVARVES